MSKCEQYWPERNKQRKFGEFTVRTMSEEEDSAAVSGLIRRTIVVSKGGQKADSLEFVQYHYVNWPDFGVPYDPSPLVEMIDLIRGSPLAKDQECLVHCSAGVGRTGTFIGIYWIMDMIDSGADVINVYNVVMEMRAHRTLMVR